MHNVLMHACEMLLKMQVRGTSKKGLMMSVLEMSSKVRGLGFFFIVIVGPLLHEEFAHVLSLVCEKLDADKYLFSISNLKTNLLPGTSQG